MASPRLEIPNPEVAMTLEELARIQKSIASNITFSLTLACPLRCSHCIVDAAPELGRTTMPIEVARYYSSQMDDLAKYGIRNISFTGGEPFLAGKQMTVLASAAQSAGIACGVVTSAHWARDLETARQVVHEYSEIQSWDISVDAFHEDFVPLEIVKNAYEAAIESERNVTIRFSYQEPLSLRDLKVLEFISIFEEARFSCQRVRPVGRGELVQIGMPQKYNPWIKPCLTQGMVVRYDGSIAPCCLNLVEDRDHPFQLGQATARPLKEIHEEYMVMPLLQLIRALGFSEPMRWLREAGLDKLLPNPLPDEACEICALMMRRPEIASFLTDMVETPEMRIRIAILSAQIFGEYRLLRTTVERFGSRADCIEEFQIAKQLLDDLSCRSN